MKKLIPLQQTLEAPFTVSAYGGLLAELYRKLNKRTDPQTMAVRLEADSPNGDAKIVIAEKHEDGGETILAEHAVRGVDDEGVAYFVLKGEVLPPEDYAVALARDAGLSEEEILNL
jgi:hypothetical protein